MVDTSKLLSITYGENESEIRQRLVQWEVSEAEGKFTAS